MFSDKQVLAISLLQALAAAAPTSNYGRRQTATVPASFDANGNIGPGGSIFTDSAHFRVYNADGTSANRTLNMLEASYACFVDDLGWRSSGLSFNDDQDSGPWTKVNVYSVPSLSGGAAGVMHSDFATGMSFLEVVNQYLTVPGVTVHEFGHGLTYHAKTWVDQGRTGAWWETVAEWFADTYQTSELCKNARAKFGEAESSTAVNLRKIVGESHQVIVDGSAGSGNYYEAWPFLSYLTYNPDNITGLGSDVVRQSFVQYDKGSNETPLHTFARLANGTSIQDVIGRYWARMAYGDIGHPTIAQVFKDQRQSLNFDNLDEQSSGTYKVKADRQPRYMGASINPLQASSGPVSASITTSGSFTATLSILNSSTGSTRYIDFVDGSAEVILSGEEEVSVVVVNTPDLIQYDPFNMQESVTAGLDYSLTLTGATA